MTRQRAGWLLALLVGAGLAGAAPFVPVSNDEVLERLPFAPADPALRSLRGQRAALAREPGNLALAVQVARRYSELGRVTGDPRFSGHAQAALAPWWDQAEPPRDVLLLRATLRQRVHEFDAALSDLDALLKVEPRHGQARLTRATVLQVRGEFDAARRECTALRDVANELVGAACTYSVAGASGRLRASYDALGAALARNPQAAPEVRLWILSMLAEMAARAGLSGEAEQQFRAALALDPSDHYTLGAYADFLLDAGRPAEVLKLVDASVRIDALVLRRALALKAVGSPALAEQTEVLSARFAASRLRGDRAHQREEARFLLHLRGDAAAALPLAQENWTVQKEVADLRLLLEAALAAKDPETVRSVRDWLARTQMEDVQLSRLLR